MFDSVFVPLVSTATFATWLLTRSSRKVGIAVDRPGVTVPLAAHSRPMETICAGDGTDRHRVDVADVGVDVACWTRRVWADWGAPFAARFPAASRRARTLDSALGSCAPRSSSRTFGTNGEVEATRSGTVAGISGDSGEATSEVANVISASSVAFSGVAFSRGRCSAASSGVPGPIRTLVGDGSIVFLGNAGAGVVSPAGSAKKKPSSLLFSFPSAGGLGAISRGATELVASRIARVALMSVDRLV